MSPLKVFVAQLPDGEDAWDVARRDPDLLQSIIDNAKPAGVWMAEYLAEHPDLDPNPVPSWLPCQEAS